MNNNGYLIDTHCHLDDIQFDENRSEIIQECLDQNIQNIFNPSIHANNFETVMTMSYQMNQQFQKPILLPALGLHPVYLDQHREDHLDLLDQSIQNYRHHIIAIGEIGIDLFLPHLDFNKQYYYYIKQLKLANHYDLPVIIHSRKAHDFIYKGLRQVPVKGGIIHAFNGSMIQAERFIQMNFKLGFGGTLTYPRSLNIRRLAVDLPLSAIVLETDAPDIHLADESKNQPNSPIHISKIAKLLAELRSCSELEIQSQCFDNVNTLFKLNDFKI